MLTCSPLSWYAAYSQCRTRSIKIGSSVTFQSSFFKGCVCCIFDWSQLRVLICCWRILTAWLLRSLLARAPNLSRASRFSRKGCGHETKIGFQSCYSLQLWWSLAAVVTCICVYRVKRVNLSTVTHITRLSRKIGLSHMYIFMPRGMHHYTVKQGGSSLLCLNASYTHIYSWQQKWKCTSCAVVVDSKNGNVTSSWNTQKLEWREQLQVIVVTWWEYCTTDHQSPQSYW